MTNRRTIIFSILAAATLALCLPVLAAAQGGYGYPDDGRNRDDDYYRRDRNGNYGRYDERYLRDSINRLDRLAKDFQRELDRDLDHSRENDSRHEDRVNIEARDFRNAVSNLKSRFNSRDLNRSYDEAQRVFQEANRTERATRHHFDNYRLASDWSQIQDELQVVADAYGISYRGGYNNGGYYPNDRNDRNDDYRRNNPNNNRNRNNDWWRRIPWPN
ncbi:MAG: hypothetical protein ACREA9_06100 [Pyrinomonadaceae bacterium]